jgi:hypothetical protein
LMFTTMCVCLGSLRFVHSFNLPYPFFIDYESFLLQT